MAHLPRDKKLLFILALIIAFATACGPPLLHEDRIGDLGRLDFHKPDAGLDGVVVGAPFGVTEPAAVEYARHMSEEIGAGLVIAYGFKSKRVVVEQPLVLTSPHTAPVRNFRAPGSIYREFRTELFKAAEGPLKFYVGIRVADEKVPLKRIDVATTGLTFEQLQALKQAYLRIRDRSLVSNGARSFDIALNPLDSISWDAIGVKNYGVLMAAEKGLVIRMPHIFAEREIEEAYESILTNWIGEALSMAMQNPSRLPEIQIKQSRYGRMDTLPARNGLRGIVIGAPHGSFDGYTAELVEELSYRTALPAVVVRGFTPTEAGGWRINVNRPTEKTFPLQGPGQEKNTDRARIIFEEFAETVSQAARGPLQLYFDFHQNTAEPSIDVATVGITAAQARAVKSAYRKIRDCWLSAWQGVASVDMLIEPIDKVTFNAVVSKQQGILSLAQYGFQFEMPAHRVFYRRETRRVYAAIMAELIEAIASLTVNPVTAARTAPYGRNTRNAVLASRTADKPQ